MTYSEAAEQIIQIGRDFHRRGWALGTSGNFSAVIEGHPRRIAITESSAGKGCLELQQILQIDERAVVFETLEDLEPRDTKPSAETWIHLAILRVRDAGSVLHTHSVWNTLVSDAAASEGGLWIHGYEMLKGLAGGVTTHEHREWLPVFPNSQDMGALARSVEELLSAQPALHGFLIQRHGLYTWGKDLHEAVRHVEILEFLLEVLWRSSEFQKITARSMKGNG